MQDIEHACITLIQPAVCMLYRPGFSQKKPPYLCTLVNYRFKAVSIKDRNDKLLASTLAHSKAWSEANATVLGCQGVRMKLLSLNLPNNAVSMAT